VRLRVEQDNLQLALRRAVERDDRATAVAGGGRARRPVDLRAP
jgi:hypothetical protein